MKIKYEIPSFASNFVVFTVRICVMMYLLLLASKRKQALHCLKAKINENKNKKQTKKNEQTLNSRKVAIKELLVKLKSSKSHSKNNSILLQAYSF